MTNIENYCQTLDLYEDYDSGKSFSVERNQFISLTSEVLKLSLELAREDLENFIAK